MRPSTPISKTAQATEPSSPPHTPTTASPPSIFLGRDPGPRSRGFTPRPHPSKSMASSSTSSIRPVGNGPKFTFRPPGRDKQLSPQSSGSSSAASDTDSSGSRSPPRSAASEASRCSPTAAPQAHAGRERIITHAAFIVEELSDFDDSDDERAGVIRPHHIEYAESDRSRSRSRNPPEIEQTVMYSLRNLRCSDDESDQDDIDPNELEFQEIIRRRREAKRIRRMTSGSIGKRTISESIGSDSDHEDLGPFLDINDVGSSARRLRRRIGDRHSLQFQDPPPPRIDELEEPNSSEDELLEGETLARELPYYHWEYISMEIDSP